MPRSTSLIENHPKKAQIVKAIIAGKLTRSKIAQTYGISDTVICRYIQVRLKDEVKSAKAARQLEEGRTALQQIEDIIAMLHKQIIACDEYLADPARPGKYNLGPRATELEIVFRTKDGGYKTASLQEILDKLEKKDISVQEIRTKIADPRKLIIETANGLARLLELTMKADGQIKENSVTITVTQYWLEWKSIILSATEGHPEVRKRIVEALEKAK